MNPDQIFEEAKKVGVNALTDAVAKYGDGYPCGFAWVSIRPARGKFITFCKKNNIGRNGVYGGWQISVNEFAPWMGQNMNVKEEVVIAVADYLKTQGLKASASSRID